MENKRRVLVCGSPDAANDVAAVCNVIATSRTLSCNYEPHDVSESAGVNFMLENGDGFHPDDILVLLLGDEYGDLVDNVFSMPQLLYEQAGDAELTRFIFIKSTEQVEGRQRDFLDCLSSYLVRARYETSDEAVKGVVSSLSLGKSNPGECLTPRDVIRAISTSVMLDPETGKFVSTTDKMTAGSGSMLLEAAKSLDFYIKQTDPKDEDETFKLDIKLDDLDTERLTALLDADNRYLAKEGRPSNTLTEFLKQHKFAAPDGRIYDRAFYLFPKSPLGALPPEEDPKEQEKKRLEKLKNDANESIRRMEASLDRDLQLIERVASTTEDDEVLAEMTRQAFIRIEDEMQKVFVPTARKYGESEDAEYLTTYSFGVDLKRICAIRNRNNDRLTEPCEQKTDELEKFLERPFCITESDLIDGVPLALMELYQYVMPETDKEKKARKKTTGAEIMEKLDKLQEGQKTILNILRTVKDVLKDVLDRFRRFFKWVPTFFGPRDGVTREQVENSIDLDERFAKLSNFTNKDHVEQMKALIRYSLKHPIDKNDGGRLYEDLSNKTKVRKAIDDLFRKYGKAWAKLPNAWRDTKKDKKAFGASAYGLMDDPDKDPFRHE